MQMIYFLGMYVLTDLPVGTLRFPFFQKLFIFLKIEGPRLHCRVDYIRLRSLPKMR